MVSRPGFAHNHCFFFSGLVVEDTPVGIQSGQAAGCTTLGVITTHTREQMELCHPDYLVNDLSRSVGVQQSFFF
jgi:beta-phosphoglucomutase-like phosphatase (HAD superfamily)